MKCLPTTFGEAESGSSDPGRHHHPVYNDIVRDEDRVSIPRCEVRGIETAPCHTAYFSARYLRRRTL